MKFRKFIVVAMIGMLGSSLGGFVTQAMEGTKQNKFVEELNRNKFNFNLENMSQQSDGYENSEIEKLLVSIFKKIDSIGSVESVDEVENCVKNVKNCVDELKQKCFKMKIGSELQKKN